MRICHITAELSPLAQRGGLGDVAAALSRHTAARGHDVRVCLPYYSALDQGALEGLASGPHVQGTLELGERRIAYSAVAARTAGSRATVIPIVCPELFDRDEIYTSDPDEHLRFAVLALAALDICRRSQWQPEVLHCHDWHAALAPALLAANPEETFARTRSILTVHNLAYQGAFESATIADLGLGLSSTGETFRFLEAGLETADALTTVSPTYAREIRTPEHGVGLEDLFRRRADVLTGILNGVDYDVWDPAVDPLIPHRYTVSEPEGKLDMRQALLGRMGLAPDPTGPVLGVVSRLVEQKGFDLFERALEGLLAPEFDLRLVVLGSGQPEYEELFRRLASENPRQVALSTDFDIELAHWIEAGSDAFLMPSRFEPCGLNQMYSLRYGTAPIVRRVGGLADTVEPFDPATGEGTGFVFDAYTPEAFRAEIVRAIEIFGRPGEWRRLRRNGMEQDFSWTRQVEEYLDLYRRLAAA